MKKSFFVLSVFLGVMLFACGGGGGGGGSGSDGDDDQTVNALEYVRDTSRIYTFQETQSATANGQSASATLTKVFSYEQVSTVPAGYGDFGDYTGPYYLEVVSKDGEETENTYTDVDGNVLVQADPSTFTRIYDNDYSGDGIPSSVVLGRTYSSTARQILYNADLDAGFWGEELGFSLTTSSTKPVAVENVTVPAGTFSALKFQLNQTISVTLDGQTNSTTYTGYQWLGKDMGLIKFTLSYSQTISGVTVQYTITDELSSVSDG